VADDIHFYQSTHCNSALVALYVVSSPASQTAGLKSKLMVTEEQSDFIHPADKFQDAAHLPSAVFALQKLWLS
jgi:hypothetical protein